MDQPMMIVGIHLSWFNPLESDLRAGGWDGECSGINDAYVPVCADLLADKPAG
jgi:hypothetical protein